MKRLLPFYAVAAVMLISSCKQDSNSPGYEYMPDMYRSPAYEGSGVDYGQDPWRVGDSLAIAQRNTMWLRRPAEGSIAQDRKGNMMNSMPYIYPNTTAGYEAAGVELMSPLRTTEANIEKGQVLYTRYCLHCHGEKGEGNGKIAQNEHITGIPAYNGTLAELPVGKMYHTLTWGKGLMGSHASQLNPQERWEVIEYVKVLQGTSVIEDEAQAEPQSLLGQTPADADGEHGEGEHNEQDHGEAPDGGETASNH